MFTDLRVDTYTNPDDWRILRVLGGYRLLLALLVLGLNNLGYSGYLFDSVRTAYFMPLITGYVAAAAVLWPAAWVRLPALAVQAHTAFIVDAVAIVALMHAGHGISNGLGALLMTPIVGSSLLLPLRLSLAHAALGTLILFAAVLFRSAQIASDYTTSGLLGLMLFATALGAGAVAQRARRSEALAARVGSDLASLARLNERIVESMETPVLVVDEDRRLRLLNGAAKRLLIDEHEFGAGQPISDLLPALEDALKIWEGDPNQPQEPIPLGADGTELIPRFTRLGFSVWSPVLVLLDDAARVREQAQQLKLAALGRLSAGIAHEIRNPLSAIHHASQLLAETPALPQAERRLLDMIQRHSGRIDRIVTDVLRLSRRDAATPANLQLADFINRSLALFLDSYTPRGTISLELSDEQARIRFDPDQLHQVLHNLWRNCFDHSGHESTRVRVQSGQINPGHRPYIDIIDDGVGIGPEIHDKLFEPFFTTAHHGTGLGLYLSREICEYNQARLIHVPRSDGTQFRLIFTTG